MKTKGLLGKHPLLFLTMLQIVLLLALPNSGFSASVVLDWDPSTDADLAGYRVYYQADSPAVPFSGTGAIEGSAPIDVANTTSATVDGLDPGRSYYFAVTAYNTAGVESVYSNIVEIPEAVPPTVAITSPSAAASVSGIQSISAGASDNVGVTSVQFYVNGALQGTATAAPFVYAWDTSALTPGSYSLSAKAFDAAGNVGVSSSVVVNVGGDAIPPTVSLSVPATTTFVSGAVTVAASASDNVGVTKLEVYDNGALAFVSNQGSASFSWDTLQAGNGTHTLAAKAYDAAGNVGLSAGVVVTVLNDLAAPTIVLNSPLGGSAVGGYVSVSANATDNVAVTKVEFYLNGALQATTTTAPYSFNWNTANVANGSYSLSAKAYDAAGNIGQSAPVGVTVFNDTTAPSVSISSPAGGGSAGGTVTVSATATDNVGVSKVEFYLNGTLLATSTVAPYSFSWDTAKFSNGSYSLAAKAYDAAGNIGQSGNVAVTVFNDTVAPSVVITSPTNGSTAGGTVTVSATASDNIGVSKVEFYLNGALQSTATSTPYAFTWNTANLSNGSYTVSAKAYDATGNVGESGSVVVTVFNDTTAPLVALSAPTAGSTASGTVAVSATATDNAGVTKVEFYINGTLQSASTTAPYSFIWQTATVANGSYTLTAKAYDAAGNVGQSAGTPVTVFNDKTAPVIKIISPTSSYLSGTNTKISASAADNVAVTKMALYVDGALKLSTNSSYFSVGWKASVGQHTIVIKAYDAANNVAAVTMIVTRQ